MSLSHLPTELVDQIVSYSDLTSFRSFRLTCTSLAHRSFHTFKDRFFRTKTLKWAKEDFDTLLAIVCHAELGNALQHLIIDATPTHSIHLWRTRKRLSEAQAIFGPYNTRPAKSPLEQKYADDTKAAEELATFFNETRYDQKRLKEVFIKLGKLESIVFEYEGMDKKYGKFGRRYCESSQHEMSRPFISTMAAIAMSNIPIKMISIHHINNFGAISIGRLESLAPSLQNFDLAFERLEVLKLNLRDWRYPDSGFELDTYRAPFAVRFLAKARNIKILDLSCYSSLENDLFEEMARHCQFAHLETCRLSLFRVNNAVDLATFLAPSSDTMKSLSLNHMVLRDDDVTWPQALQELASLPTTFTALEELELVNLFSRVGSRIILDEFGVTTRLLVGGKGRAGTLKKQLLSQVEDFHDGGSGPAWHLAAVAYPFVGLRT